MTKGIQIMKMEHAPTLNTVIMVENTLARAKESVITVAALKRALPKQVNHNTLKSILIYLEESNKIAVSMRGITWMHNANARIGKAIARGMEI
ncbi:MAG: hypothetical protein WCY41_00245 [Candidatus Micrarchaeia archaeon]